MSKSIPYKQIIDRVKSDIDWIAEQAHAKGYNEAKLIYQNLNAESDYQRGLDDAWEAARKISLMSPDEIEKVFPGAAKYNRYNLGYSGVEAIEKLKAYEEQKKADAEIKVGDEVEAYSGRAVVFGTFTDTKGEKFCRYWYPSDDSFNKGKTENLKKTGRHFPQVAELIKAMKGKHRDCHTCKHKVVSSIECVDCRGFGKWEPKEGAE